MRYRSGEPAGFVESLFCKLNQPEGRALWLKVTFLRRAGGSQADAGSPFDRCEAWAIAFDPAREGAAGAGHLALRTTWPASEARVGTGGLDVEVGPVHLQAGAARGALEGPAGAISWDLTFDTEGRSFEHLPAPWMYDAAFPRSKACSPWVSCRFSGEVRVRGELWRVQSAPGMVGHNWGASHARAWTWAHCNVWDTAPGVTVEGVTARVPVGRLATPWLTTLLVDLPGERMTFSTLNPRHRVRSWADGLSWRVQARAGDRRVSVRFAADVDRFVGVDYEDPDGDTVHCLNTKIGAGEITVLGRTPSGWVPLLEALSEGSAALEVGRRDTTHGVEIRIP